jgi:hypothetical protein
MLSEVCHPNARVIACVWTPSRMIAVTDCFQTRLAGHHAKSASDLTRVDDADESMGTVIA